MPLINTGTMEKLKILADSAKYDVSCSSSGSNRKNTGKIGNSKAAGICHSWSSDGRCISLLKILMTNNCVYNCEYCVNRRSNDFPRASFEPEELASLTIEFYRRNYIEGLFLSSAVEISPDYTAERIAETLDILRNKYGFCGYIHAKIIPGVSEELLDKIGSLADRVSVNIEMPTSESLAHFAPQKNPKEIFAPMKKIAGTLIERDSLTGAGNMFKNKPVFINSSLSTDLSSSTMALAPVRSNQLQRKNRKNKSNFAPAGQTTQMIIGLSGDTDSQILTTSQHLYRTFRMKRVYYSAYIPVVTSPILPDRSFMPPLEREHRIYQADWLLRFYGFSVEELFDEKHRNLDPDLDPKVTWAIRNLENFPVEVNKAPLEMLMRVPGIGEISARRIVRQRRVAAVRFEDLKKMGVVVKRAKYFVVCSGRYHGTNSFDPEGVRRAVLQSEEGTQLSIFDNGWQRLPQGERMEKLSQDGII